MVATITTKEFTRKSQECVTGDRTVICPVRAELLRLGSPAENSLPDGDALRNGARELGIRVAADLEHYWNASAVAPAGSIDVIDMFSGCGGMSAGFRAINGHIPSFRLIGAVDIDPDANRSYERNFGVAPSCLDVGQLARDDSALSEFIEATGRNHDNPLVLIGCAPCQGFSSYRNAAGAGDARNSLFVDFARVAAALEPDVVVVENVPEIISDRYWPFVQEARKILEGAGYHVYLSIHNMAEFAVPQERFRALLLGMRSPFTAPRGFLPREAYRTVRDAIGHLPPVAAGERIAGDPLHYTAGHRASTLEVIQAVPADGGYRPSHVGPPSLQRMAERMGKPGYEDVYGRLWWDRPAITITAHARNPASGRFVHPEQDRGLSVREAALLQGYPSGYWFEGSLDRRFRQIGNAVPPPFAAFLAAHLLGELLADAPSADPAGRGITKPIGSTFSRIIPALKAGHSLSPRRKA